MKHRLDYAPREPRRPVETPRWMAVAAIILAAIAAIVYYATDATPQVLMLLLSDGLLAGLWVAAAGLGGWTILSGLGLQRRMPRPLEWSAGAGLGLGIFSLAGLGLGLAGLLNMLTALLLPLMAAALGLWRLWPDLRERHNRGWDLHPWAAGRVDAQWLWIVPAIVLGMALVAASILPGALWRPLDPHPYDSLSYHLQVPREWYELGRIVPLEHNVFSFFPFHMEMQFLLAMHVRGGPWAGMYLAQFISLGHGVLTVLAVYGIGVMLRPQAKLAAIAAASVVAVLPWVVMLSTVTFVESGLMLYTALAAGLLLAGWGRTSDEATKRRSDEGRRIGDEEGRRILPPSLRRFVVSSFTNPFFILAGAMAGFACGIKYTAVPMLLAAAPAALLGAWVLSRRDDRPPGRRLIGGLVAFVLIGGAVASPWLVRNWAWVGNPVFPLALRTLGQAHLDDVQVERWERAHRPPPQRAGIGGRAAALWDELVAAEQYGSIRIEAIGLRLPLFVPLVLAGVVAARRDPRALALILLCGMMLLIWLGFTHLISRFMVMAVPLAAVLIVYLPRWLSLGALIVLLGASLFYLHPRLVDFADMGRAGLFGVQDLRLIQPQELQAMDRPEARVALIGDAGAFFFQIPMERLSYRTVFDLHTRDRFIEAWLGNTPQRRPGDWLLVINPMEIERLSRTYYRIPSMPPDFPGPRDRAYVIRLEDAGE